MREKLEVEHALKADSILDREARKFEEMKESLNSEIDGLRGENTALTQKREEMELEGARLQSLSHRLQGEIDDIRQQLEDKDTAIFNMRSDLKSAEMSRIKLLETFMSEMDRMRDEIR